MKKNILLIVFVFFSMVLLAQNPVLNLSNYLRNDMLDKAYENLKIAMTEERYTSDAKTWLLRGNLYYAVYRCYDLASGVHIGMPADSLKFLKGAPLNDFKRQKTPDGKAYKWEWDKGFSVLILDDKVYSFTEPANGVYKEIATSPSHALELARESYYQTIKLDPRYMGDQTFPTNAYEGLSIISDGFLNMGVLDFNNVDFENAFNHFSASHELKKGLGFRSPRDTIPGFYALRSAANFVRLMSEKGEFEKAIKVIEKAKLIDPENVELALSEADTYLKMKDYLKTKEILEQILVNQPDNSQLYFIIGNIYDELAKDTTHTAAQIEENYQLTIKYYEKAIELNPDYFEALFNLGTMYNNKAVDKFNAAQKLQYGDERFDVLMKEMDDLFVQALPYLEKAHALNEKDPDPMRMLYTIYVRQKKNDEAAAIRKKIDALKKE